jgi:predicted esterase
VTQDRAVTPHTHHLRVQRTARYFTLGGANGAPRAIWFVLHGYGQLAGEFIRYFGDLAADDALIVAPEALNRFYLLGVDKAPARDRPVGATWMTREDRASEIADYVEYLDALYDDVAAEAVADGAVVNVVGFSQGAATATRWVTHGRSTVNRLVLWGGLIPPETDLSRGAPTFRGAHLTLVLGTRDQYVDAAALAAERARLSATHIPHDVVEFDGGHAISRSAFPGLLSHAPSRARSAASAAASTY